MYVERDGGRRRWQNADEPLLHQQQQFQASISRQFEGVDGEVYERMPPSVGWMFLQPCNFKCSYCFANFDDLKGKYLTKEQNLQLCEMLAKKFDKVTFLGGEPTLAPYLHDMLRIAKAHGCTTSIITNGSKMLDERLVRSFAGLLDWVTLSIDSAVPQTHARLGRGYGARPKPGAATSTATTTARPLSNDDYLEISRLVKAHGMALKISTVVNQLNKDEDMSAFIRAMAPSRWKLFQCLYIAGENSGRVDDLLVTKDQMEAFVARHQHLTDTIPMYSSTEETKNGYACITPAGTFLSDIDNEHHYSRPILDVGVDEAWSDIDYRPENFRARGGFYDWRRSGGGCDTATTTADVEDLGGTRPAVRRAAALPHPKLLHSRRPAPMAAALALLFLCVCYGLWVRAW